MTQKDIIIKEIETLTDNLDEVLEFIRYLKFKRSIEKFDITRASESSLKKEWSSSEEDEAWQHL